MKIEAFGEYCRVTFSEKPEREVLNALRGAGFRWGAGSWSGRLDAVPEAVKELVEVPEKREENSDEQSRVETTV